MLLQVTKDTKNREELVEALAALDGELFPESAYSRESIAGFVEEKNYQVYCIQEEGKLLAYLFVLDSLDVYEVLKIGVRVEERRKGLARTLLEQIGEKNILLEVREGNLGARAFYESLGFIQISLRKQYYRDSGENALILLKNMEVQHEI